jgi:hypothetical protein
MAKQWACQEPGARETYCVAGAGIGEDLLAASWVMEKPLTIRVGWASTTRQEGTALSSSTVPLEIWGKMDCNDV